MAHTAPAVTVEIALTTAPMASSPSWTDVTAYVDQMDYPITIERGRSDAQSSVQPGTCTLVLKNDDKRFTPGYTGGPYSSNVIPGKLLRVTITHNSNTYRRFFGYITSFDMGWPGGVTQQNRVTVTAVDVLGLLSQVKLKNILDHLYIQSGPVALWPLDDDDGTHHAQELSGYRNPALDKIDRASGGVCRFDGGRGLPAIAEKWSRSVRMKSDVDESSWTALGETIDLQGATGSVGIGGWVRFDERNDDTAVWLTSLRLDSTYSIAVQVASTSTIAYLRNNSGIATANTDPGPPRIVDGKWHHVFVLYEEAGLGSLTLFVDGVEISSDAMGAGFPSVPSTATVTVGCALRSDGTKETDAATNARYAYWGVWTDSVATSLDVAALYEAGKANWESGDRTSTRIGRVCDWLGLPSNRQSLERGLSDVAIGNIRNLTAAEYIDQLTTAEQGFFYQAGNGTATFHARDHRWNSPTVAATLTAHKPDETWTTDVEQVVNSVEVTHRSGSVAVSDRNSKATYGPRELSVETALSTAAQAFGIAEYLLALRSTLTPRMSDYVFDLLTESSQATRDAVLGLDLGSHFQLNSLPTQAHTTSAKFWVEGISETISIHTWEIGFVTSPHVAMDGFWVLGTTSINTGLKLGY